MQRESGLPKVTQPVSSRVEIQSKAHLAPKPGPFPVCCGVGLQFFSEQLLFSALMKMLVVMKPISFCAHKNEVGATVAGIRQTRGLWCRDVG